MGRILGREPVMYMVLVEAAIALVVSLGFELTGDQTAAILGFAAAILGFIARQTVTPVADPRAPDGTPLARSNRVTPGA